MRWGSLQIWQVLRGSCSIALMAAVSSGERAYETEGIRRGGDVEVVREGDEVRWP